MADNIRIFHISDLHVKNLKHFEQFRETFINVFSEARKADPDLIVFTGDLFHTKITVTGESISLAKEFFSNLAEIAPVYVIYGNHDVVIRNKNRISPVKPVLEEIPRVTLYERSGFYDVPGTNLTFAAFSVLDDNILNFRKEDLSEDRTYIGLYHGCIRGTKNKFGYEFSGGESPEIFEGLDYVLLGDIHEAQSIDNFGRMRYAGSLLQNNHGEGSRKGYLLWDIKDKENFTVDFHEVKSSLRFITVNLEKDGTLPKIPPIPKDSYIRLISETPLPLDVMRAAIDKAKIEYQPKNLTFFDKGALARTTAQTLHQAPSLDNLRDLGVQEKLIRAYLKKFELPEPLISEILALNSKYSSAAESSDDIARNVFWSLESVEWDNLFNYAEGNEINLERLEGVVGILGKNYIGKTNSILSALFTIYNSVPKNSRKNVNIINQTKDSARSSVSIRLGEERIKIERTLEKYKKVLHGKETIEARTDVNVTSENLETGAIKSLNGVSRSDTDKNIRRLFGTMDDLLLTSMSSQLDSLSFVKEGSTKRKEILAKFLDLEMFDRKFKIAKEDFLTLKARLKDLEEVDYDKEIAATKKTIEAEDASIASQKNSCQKLEKTLVAKNKQLVEVEEEIKATPVQMLNGDDIGGSMANIRADALKLEQAAEAQREMLNSKRERAERVDSFLASGFDFESLLRKQQELNEKESLAVTLKNKLRIQTSTVFRIQERVGLLKEVPCGDEYQNCKFIKDAFGAKEIQESEERVREELRTHLKKVEDSISALKKENISDKIFKYEEIKKTQKKVSAEITSLEFEIYKKESRIEKLENELDALAAKMEEYHKNEKSICELERKLEHKEDLGKEISKLKSALGKCNREIIKLYQRQGSSKHILDALKENHRRCVNQRKVYSAYDYYLNCMHVNGIANEIIKSKLPAINDEIQKILSNVVDFQVLIELEGNKLEIKIKHPKFEPRCLEMGSGAEKTLGAIAIRLALISVTSLPIPNFFVFDEPAVDLDEDNLEGFTKILEVIKGYFKCVFLITHLESLKDSVDEVLIIEKDKAGYAKLRH